MPARSPPPYSEVVLMTRHRDFDIRRFVSVVPLDGLARFFECLQIVQPSGWASLNGDALDLWLREPEQSEIEALVRQHLRRINDLGNQATGALIAACERYGIQPESRESFEALALRLFTETPEAFSYAWSRYLIYTNAEHLTEFYFPAGNLGLNQEAIHGLRDGLRQWFDEHHQGHQCRVEAYEDDGELIIAVQRGHYVRTISLFADDSDKVSYRNFRPVVDDVMVYDPRSSILRIKATTKSEREAYLWNLSHHLAGRDELFNIALRERIYTLGPIQDETFDFHGDAEIVEVRLTRAKIQLGPRAYADIHSADVRATLAYGAPGINLQSGPLLAISLLFLFRVGKSEQPVHCSITPPSKGKIPDDVFGAKVDAYLRAQGIKLR
jgi:hypothetical protein